MMNNEKITNENVILNSRESFSKENSSEKKEQILIIEDDIVIAEIERDYLEMENMTVTIATDGKLGMDLALEKKFDLIILDLMLPTIDGFEICKRLRDKLDIPILMVTARLEDMDKIYGLGLGADDYIEKPFVPKVLVARVKAHLAQYQRLCGTNKQLNDVINAGGIELNKNSREVFVNGERIELKNKEYELLHLLMSNVGILFSKETIYDRIWGMDAMGDVATVAVHINRLREKIEVDSEAPHYIQTVRGVGYRFSLDSENE